MKIIITVIILSLLFSSGANASEIFGSISTNPNAPSGGGNNPPTQETPPAPPIGSGQSPATGNSGGAVTYSASNPPANKSSAIQPAEIRPSAAKPEVLGAKIYSDGTLLRAPDHKIYSIKGQTKKLIANLKELSRYRGQPIIEVSANELSGFETREYDNGELIRQRGEVKVYEIVKGGKHHIFNLEELKARYFGREIFNISPAEMELY